MTEVRPRRWHASLHARIVAVVLVALIPGFVIAFVASANERRDARRRAELQTSTVVATAAERYSQSLHDADSLLQTIADLSKDLPGTPCAALLADLVRETTIYDDLVVTAPDGTIRCSATGRAAPNSVTSSSWLAATENGAFTVAHVDVARNGDDSKLWVARALRGGTGPNGVRAVLAARFSLQALGGELVPATIDRGTTLTVVDGSTIVYDRMKRGSSTGSAVAESQVVMDLRTPADKGSVIARGVDGVQRVYAFERLEPNNEVVVLAGLPTRAAFAQANHDFRVRIAWLLAAAIVALAAAVALGELVIGRRVRSLISVTREIGEGNLDARTGVAGNDELGELAASLDSMVSEIQRRDDERLRLLGHVVQAAEAERRRIAGDVHDDSIQVMTAHVMGLQLIRRRVDDPALAERLRELEDTGRAAIARLRDLVFDLHSPVLDELGLGPAIEALAERTFEGEPVRWSVVDRLPEAAPIAARDTAYRVAQEALQNARRHAQPTRVTVQLSRESDTLVVRVEDDGVGFEPDEVGHRPGHRGLLGVRERAEAAGGEMEIVSSRGGGTTVTCRIPWRLGVPGETPPVRVS